jgi:hypothetical protein
MKESLALVEREIITDYIEHPQEDPEVVFKRTGRYPDGSKNKTQWLKHIRNSRRSKG